MEWTNQPLQLLLQQVIQCVSKQEVQLLAATDAVLLLPALAHAVTEYLKLQGPPLIMSLTVVTCFDLCLKVDIELVSDAATGLGTRQ